MTIEWNETKTTKCRLVVLRDGQHATDATPEDLRAAGYHPARTGFDGLSDSDVIYSLKHDLDDARAELAKAVAAAIKATREECAAFASQAATQTKGDANAALTTHAAFIRDLVKYAPTP